MPRVRELTETGPRPYSGRGALQEQWRLNETAVSSRQIHGSRPAATIWDETGPQTEWIRVDLCTSSTGWGDEEPPLMLAQVRTLFQYGFHEAGLNMVNWLMWANPSLELCRALTLLLIELDLVNAAHAVARSAVQRYPTFASIQRLWSVLQPGEVRRSALRGQDRSAEIRWLREHGGQHKGKWVALAGGELMAASDRLGSVLKMLSKAAAGIRPFLHYVER